MTCRISLFGKHDKSMGGAMKPAPFDCNFLMHLYVLDVLSIQKFHVRILVREFLNVFAFI